MNSFNIGDKVWMIKSFEDVSLGGKMLKHPLEKKITQLVHTKDGVLYQVKGGHFHESWIGKIVFDSKEKAEKYITKYHQNSIVNETII